MRKRTKARTLAALALLATCLPVTAAQAGFAVASDATEETELGCDASAIRWILPGHFEDARERAVRERRIVVIKGISFGVNDAGAKCATKGTW